MHTPLNFLFSADKTAILLIINDFDFSVSIITISSFFSGQFQITIE